jgi:hypothetical protein
MESVSKDVGRRISQVLSTPKRVRIAYRSPNQLRVLSRDFCISRTIFRVSVEKKCKNEVIVAEAGDQSTTNIHVDSTFRSTGSCAGKAQASCDTVGGEGPPVKCTKFPHDTISGRAAHE